MPDLTSHAAAGPAAGYLFQPERALYHLAASPRGSKVGVETLGDVVRVSGIEVLWEEDKHSISPSNNPLSDRSKNLWNTLNIWLNAVETATVDLNHTHFILTTNATLPENNLAKVIGLSHDSKSVANAVNLLRHIGKNPPDGLKPIFESVLSLPPPPRHSTRPAASDTGPGRVAVFPFLPSDIASPTPFRPAGKAGPH